VLQSRLRHQWFAFAERLDATWCPALTWIMDHFDVTADQPLAGC